MNILQINSSARREGAISTRVANDIVARLQAKHSNSRLVLRDLAATPHPTLDEAALGALFTKPEERTAAQQARVALDDVLIAEIQAADIVVLGVPMYNFGVTSQLKNWLDAIARAQVTFRYGANGPEGMLTGKTVYLALARGGVYRDTPSDSQMPYLKTILGFLGMSDLQPVYAEGVAMGPEALQNALTAAQTQIEQAIPA
ncbi:MAG TPA: NAD(P)H-dependent oxidoreductase [Herbaspirillum sp.]|jgi:FMN-dependent NADH-azoreductase